MRYFQAKEVVDLAEYIVGDWVEYAGSGKLPDVFKPHGIAQVEDPCPEPGKIRVASAATPSISVMVDLADVRPFKTRAQT